MREANDWLWTVLFSVAIGGFALEFLVYLFLTTARTIRGYLRDYRANRVIGDGDAPKEPES